jgi:tricorn protease-like protein
VSPDSKLSLELYLTGLTLKEGIGYSLWDIKKNKEIWHLDSRVAPQVPPLWSSDYSKFVVLKEQSAIENRADILVLDNTGRTIFQTDFASNYSYSFVSRYMSLSPNGRYLVTWISLGNDANIPDRPSIVLLDLKTGIATNLCMTSYGIGSDLIWSPDSNWLITRPDSVDVNVLINIYTNKIYSISLPLDGSIIGWMNRP